MFTLALPNGSLFQRTIDLLKRVGLTISVSERSFIAYINEPSFFKRVLIMRPQDIPEAVFSGTADCGICGWDCVIESGLKNKLIKAAELSYSKNLSVPVRIVVFGKSQKLRDAKATRVTSEYPNLTRKFFKKAKISFSHGTTEAKVVNGQYDYGVGVTETGQSLKANGLVIVKTLLVTPTVFISRQNFSQIISFGKLLIGALEAEKFQLLKMNISPKIKNNVLRILPALKAPTVNRLSDGNLAIETVVKKEQITLLLTKLLKIGATGIIIQDINIVL
jgi:ATP phosphoribosyltransferase